MKSITTFKKILKQKYILNLKYLFSNYNPKFKIVQNPKDVSKLIFDQNGKCLLFQHKNGEAQLKWIIRVGTSFTILNTLLTGAQYAYPIFGSWNHFSFGLCTGLGYLMLILLQTFSSRTVHRLYLQSNLQYIDLVFFNAFWIPKTITFHISQFQEPIPAMFGFTRFQLTTIGKIWIKLQKNEFRNIIDYQQTLDSILLGKPLTNLNIPKFKIKK